MSADAQNTVFPGLKDRVVIVTGAGQGIGRVVAKSFATAGAHSVIAEVNEKKGAAVAEEIMRAGGQALGFCDGPVNISLAITKMFVVKSS